MSGVELPFHGRQFNRQDSILTTIDISSILMAVDTRGAKVAPGKMEKTRCST